MGLNDEYNLNLPQNKLMVISAGLGKRAGAFLVDIFIIYFLLLSPMVSLVRFKGDVLSTASHLLTADIGLLTVISGTFGLISLLYFSLFQTFSGKTPGMGFFKLQTTPMNFSQAVVRNAFLVPIFPFNIIAIVDVIYLIIKKRRFLEKLSNTVVIEIVPY